MTEKKAKKVNKSKEALSSENIQLRDIVKEKNAKIAELETELNSLSVEKAEEALSLAEGKHLAIGLVKDKEDNFQVVEVEFSLDNNSARVVQSIPAKLNPKEPALAFQSAHGTLVEKVFKEYMK